MNEIGYSDRRAIYEQAIAAYGVQAQTWMVIEEMSELAKAICKMQRGSGSITDLVDEIADVTIMLEQLRIIHDVNEAVAERMDFKVSRLRERLGIKE